MNDLIQSDKLDMTYLDVKTVVEKIDDSHKTFNRRVLHIQEGVIKYHSKIPKGFSSKKKSNTLLPPKAGVRVEDVIDLFDTESGLKR